MKRRWFSLAVLAGVLLMGCGGIEAPPELENPASLTAALVSCTATCADGSTLSCSGETCSATENSQVTCDGVTQNCPVTTSCTTQRSCEGTHGRLCFDPRVPLDCCQADGSPGLCYCGSRWVCPIP